MEDNENLNELSAEAARRAERASERVSDGARRTAEKFGDQMKSFAGRIRDTAPRVESAIHNSTERLAQKFERGGSYLTERQYEDTTRNITQYIRRHPVMSMMVGIAAGLLLASKRRH
ncbi:MAG: hypothetical protein E6J74_17745 [Deltaproteobacteria bacterium]|nr:MAG: hypothetical protein E6J74_17745 [Deltaproteobacteria bacterium]